MMSATKLLRVGPMARRLGVTVRWLRAEAEAGRIPHIRAEQIFLFDPDTVEQVLVERARQPRAGEGRAG